ncbi:MAG TPA: lipid II flippase MurJ [Mycobacteriales bacterium]|nr:lipid II flippase MurJ [Mycobacteriales bacterium]
MLTTTAGSGLRHGLLGAAASIAVVTVAARAVGFLRTVVFARIIGPTCLGSTYYTANTVPNIVFEIVAGGALASVVVPVLAGPVARADADAVRRTAGALLTWAVLLLTPLTLAVLAFAGPIVGLLVGSPSGGCTRAEMVAVGGRMLAVFAPQVVLYGVGVVLTGVLQAHRRFLGPALAPLLSSVVVVAAYLTFGLLGADAEDLAALPRAAELVLSVGTTLGVVALSLSLLLPLRVAGIPLRPALRFPPGVAPRVRALAVAGTATLAAQQASVVVVLRLANDLGPTGAAALYTFAWTVFLLPWAVLAVPLATSAFPELSARAAARDDAGFAATAAATTRAVLLVAFAAAALLVATATPTARVLVLAGPGGSDPAALAWALRVFAPGLVGYALVAHLGRALYARGAAGAATAAIAAGWAAVVLADVVLVPLAPREWRVAALGLGNSLGMTLAGVLLLAAVARVAGRAALRRTARAAAAGIAGGAGGAAAGSLVAATLAGAGVWASVAAALVVATVTAGGFTAGALLVDRPGVLRLLSRVPSRPAPRSGTGAPPAASRDGD